MPRAFGEEDISGNVMFSYMNRNMDFSAHIQKKHAGNAHARPVDARTGAPGAGQFSCIATGAGAASRAAPGLTLATSGTPGAIISHVPSLQRRLEGISAVLSLLCLVGVIITLGVNGPIPIRLGRIASFASRDPEFAEHMRLWHAAAGESCGAGTFDLILTRPPWENEDKHKYDGFAMEGIVRASQIEMASIAFFIYLFSTAFQGFRCWKFGDLCDPEKGPEFSRWLEYAFTSPLQILLVALTCLVFNIDILLGYFGMQLALVLMGADIERQIKKIYLRNSEKPQHTRFYHVLSGWGVADIRGWVYILASWTLHLLIWGVPGLWGANFTRWGISGSYAYAHKYQTQCGDPEFTMPWFVDLIFWGQFICFTLFGVVCSVQFGFASPLGESTGKNGAEYKKRWARYSLFYTVLSVSAKTILEVGFLGLVIMSPRYLVFDSSPAEALVRYANVTNVTQLGDARGPRPVPVPTTCFHLAPGTK